MEPRDMWEHQVNILTKHCKKIDERIDALEEQLHYFENVMIILISALKEGGIIVESPEGDHSFE